MRKKIIIPLLASFVLTACGSSDITTGNQPLDNAVYSSKTISLAPYTGLKAEKKIYRVTEEALDQAMAEQLEDFAEYESVTRPSQESDWVYADFTAKADGKTIREESDYYFTLGEQELGAEFDQELTGVSKGDQLEFTISYDSDFDDVDLAGQTVLFNVNITDIKEEILPEIDDAFVKKNLDYDSYEEFAESVRESLEQTYKTESTENLQEDLLSQVMDASSILQYSKEEYEEAKAAVDNTYNGYAEMFGTDLDSLLESLGVTEEEIEEEIQNALCRTMVIQAIIQNENLTLSSQEYEDGTAYYMEQNEYDSKDEFLDDYGEDEVRRQLLEDKVLKFLSDHAEITEVEAEYE